MTPCTKSMEKLTFPFESHSPIVLEVTFITICWGLLKHQVHRIALKQQKCSHELFTFPELRN